MGATLLPEFRSIESPARTPSPMALGGPFPHGRIVRRHLTTPDRSVGMARVGDARTARWL
jgi:hypothetical protein